jgi:hypothetical protein
VCRTCYSGRLASSVLLDNYGVKPWNEGKLSLSLNGYEAKKKNLKTMNPHFKHTVAFCSIRKLSKMLPCWVSETYCCTNTILKWWTYMYLSITVGALKWDELKGMDAKLLLYCVRQNAISQIDIPCWHSVQLGACVVPIVVPLSRIFLQNSMLKWFPKFSRRLGC